MLIVNVKKDIEKALKQYKRKVFKTKQSKKVSARRHHTKKSVLRREEVKHAQYVERMYGNKNND